MILWWLKGTSGECLNAGNSKARLSPSHRIFESAFRFANNMTKSLKITYCPVGELTPYMRNARTHSEEQIDQVAASIKEFGFTNPILLDGGNSIIAGHGRLLAAKKIGLRQVPTITLDHMTEAQKRAYIIADNKLALNAGWDDELRAMLTAR